jgi:hypothetical protein
MENMKGRSDQPRSLVAVSACGTGPSQACWRGSAGRFLEGPGVVTAGQFGGGRQGDQGLGRPGVSTSNVKGGRGRAGAGAGR